MREYAAIGLGQFTYFAVLYSIILCALFAAYFPLAIFSLYCTIRKGRRSRSNWALFSISLLIIVMTTIYTIAYVSHYVRAIMLIQRGVEDWAHDKHIVRLSYVHGFVGSMTGLGPIFWINDGLVVWRALELFKVNGRVRKMVWIGLAFLMIFPLISDFKYVLMLRTAFAFSPDVLGLMITAQSISILVNVGATAAIAYEALKYRSVVAASRSHNALFILVESGFMYIFFQLFAIAVFYAPYIRCNCLSGDTLSMTQTYVDMIVDLMPVIAASYPVLLIIAITFHFSLRDTIQYSESHSSSNKITTTPSFRFIHQERTTSAIPSDSNITLGGLDGMQMSRVTGTLDSGITESRGDVNLFAERGREARSSRETKAGPLPFEYDLEGIKAVDLVLQDGEAEERPNEMKVERRDDGLV